MDLQLLQSLYISAQHSNYPVRRHVSKLINNYNSQQSLQGLELFDPLFFLEETCKPYYDHLLSVSDDYRSSFNYQVYLQTSIARQFMYTNSLYNYLEHNKSNLNLLYLDQPIQYINYHTFRFINGCKFYSQDNDIINLKMYYK